MSANVMFFLIKPDQRTHHLDNTFHQTYLSLVDLIIARHKTPRHKDINQVAMLALSLRFTIKMIEELHQQYMLYRFIISLSKHIYSTFEAVYFTEN